MYKTLFSSIFLASLAASPIQGDNGQNLWDINNDREVSPSTLEAEGFTDEWDTDSPAQEEAESPPSLLTPAPSFLNPFIEPFTLIDAAEEELPGKPSASPNSEDQNARSTTTSLKRKATTNEFLPIVANDLPGTDKGEHESLEDAIAPLPAAQLKTPPKTILINFNNVSVIEYIRFISRITNKNFLFNQDDLQFNVTIISEEPTTLDNVMTALIQELQINGLSLIEQENSFIIHKNPDIRGVAPVHANGVPSEIPRESEIITQVFKLNTLDPEKAAAIAQPLLSVNALISTSEKTQHIIITDLVSNIEQIIDLFKNLDAPNSGLVIGQYVVRNTPMDTLIELSKQIMEPIAQHQTLTFVPHASAQSIFVVSSPFLVERTISVLQHIDTAKGATRIYDLEELRFAKEPPKQEGKIRGYPGELPDQPPEGRWELTPEGERIFRPGLLQVPDGQPPGRWILDAQGNWYFVPEEIRSQYPSQEGLRRAGLPIEQGETPQGRWVLDEDGNWVFQLAPSEALQPERLLRKPHLEEDLPLGHIERTKFYLHKLQYRRGEDIVEAMRRIGDSIGMQETANVDLLSTIQSAQWLTASNALIFTGTETSLAKVRELIDEIDRPLRQVFIEMLILDTSLEDSLNYGVAWGTRSQGGSTSTAQAFVGGRAALATALLGRSEGPTSPPNAAPAILGRTGYHAGIVGERLTHGGAVFSTMGAFLEAIHSRTHTNVLLNPKIITEDNKTAEIFVGENVPYLTQSVTNDEGSIVTGNFEYRDVGTTLRVTPIMGHGNIITLEIEEENSQVVEGSQVQVGDSGTTSGPTTRLNRTNATIHIPDRHFVILSGLVRDVKEVDKNQVPCLGGIPFIGAANKFKQNLSNKRNLMIFIRPQIIDTDEQFNKLTRQQQEIMKQKEHMQKCSKYEVDEALKFLNLKPTCYDECR